MSGRFEVLTAGAMKNIVWDVMTCTPLDVYRRFGWTWCLHLQGGRVNRVSQASRATFKILTAVTMKNRHTLFWNVTPCSLVEVQRRFVGVHYLHLQGSSKQISLSACLLSILFYPEDGDSRFIRNVPKCLLEYTTSHPRSWYSSN
jgi:hypothetical protein